MGEHAMLEAQQQLTSKEQDLSVLRHSTAHLMAHAVLQLFPSAKMAIGPVIENGFYYDFHYPDGFTPADLVKIEERMRALVAADLPLARQAMSRAQAIAFFAEKGQTYKVALIESFPQDEPITLYTQGDFTDLCRGPHVVSTGRLGHFKLTKLAGAYWRGNADNEMLQRIYGTAWPDQAALSAYLQRLELAEKRDHRKLATKMDLFHLHPASPGMVFWHPAGWTIYTQLQNYIRFCCRKFGYREVHTPQLVDRRLLERSGHWGKFGEGGIFTTQSENREYAVKPMNCPCHVQIYNKGVVSYKDLPLRLSEFGACHRNEPSGTLHGLMRVRAFVQDDGHIFCTPDQIQSEVAAFITQIQQIYHHLGFEKIAIKLSTRPDERIGDDAIWDSAEQALKEALNEQNLPWTLSPGEGAFYGPKIEFSLHDCLDRVWQCGTMQLDFNMPDRLGATYVDRDGKKKPPVMLHRAMLGSLERFVGILLEHTLGHLPFWLSPVQAVVMNITDSQADYARSLTQRLFEQGFRVESDLRTSKVGLKIREHILRRVPYMLIVGAREEQTGLVSVRTQVGEDWGSITWEECIERFRRSQARQNE